MKFLKATYHRLNLRDVIYLSIAIGTLLFFALKYIRHDLYWDEIMSLHFYVFHDFGQTTFAENFRLNNHIFSNLYNNAIGKLIGIENLYDSFDRIWILRTAQLPFTVGTIVFCYLFASRFFHKNAGVLCAVILVTTLPLLNYMTQLRGYNLSMFFVIATLYFSFLFIENKKHIHLIASSLCLYFLLYTILSNVFFVIPFCGLWFLSWAYLILQDFKGNSESSDKSKQLFKILAAYFTVSVMVIWTYSPYLERILGDQYITRIPENRFYIFTDFLPLITHYFVSARYLLFLLGCVGVYFLFSKKSNPSHKKNWLILLFLYLAAFSIPFLRNDIPKERHLLQMLPVFAVILAVPVAELIGVIKSKYNIGKLGIPIVFFYCISALFGQYNNMQKTLAKNIDLEVRALGIAANFYQSENYRISDLAKFIQQKANIDYPILMMPRELDMISAAQYIKSTGFDTYLPKKIDYESKTQKLVMLHVNPDNKKYLKKHIKYPFDSKEYPGTHAEKRFALSLDFVKTCSPFQKYYIISSYEKRLNSLYRKYYADEYLLEKLNPGKNDFNLYLLSKKQVVNADKLITSS